TLIWQDRREVGFTSKAASSIWSSSGCGVPTIGLHFSSTCTRHVAQVQPPPHSATMPPMSFLSAASITVEPISASTSCLVPSCSMKVILGISLLSIPPPQGEGGEQQKRVHARLRRALRAGWGRHLNSNVTPPPARARRTLPFQGRDKAASRHAEFLLQIGGRGRVLEHQTLV